MKKKKGQERSDDSDCNHFPKRRSCPEKERGRRKKRIQADLIRPIFFFLFGEFLEKPTNSWKNHHLMINNQLVIFKWFKSSWRIERSFNDSLKGKQTFPDGPEPSTPKNYNHLSITIRFKSHNKSESSPGEIIWLKSNISISSSLQNWKISSKFPTLTENP